MSNFVISNRIKASFYSCEVRLSLDFQDLDVTAKLWISWRILTDLQHVLKKMSLHSVS